MIICVVFEMLLNTNRDIDAIAAADDFNYVYSISRSEFLDAFLPAFALKFQLRSLELLVALIVSLCYPSSLVKPTTTDNHPTTHTSEPPAGTNLEMHEYDTSGKQTQHADETSPQQYEHPVLLAPPAYEVTSPNEIELREVPPVAEEHHSGHAAH